MAGVSENTMATRRCLAILGMAILACIRSAYADEQRYVFTSVVGQSKVITKKQAQTPVYSIETGDVTVETDSCGERNYRICFLVPNFAVVMPKDPPAQGTAWTVDGEEFRVIGVIENLEWLGRTIADVFVIGVKRRPGLGNRHFRLLFSYSEGLLAFQEEPGILFVAGDLPSLGHSK